MYKIKFNQKFKGIFFRVITKMKFLVTGGAGFIGSHLVKFLVNQNHSVVVIDNLHAENPNNLKNVLDKIEFHQLDILDYDGIKKIVEEIDGIFHHAALTSLPESFEKKDEYFKVNVIGTENIFKLANEYKFKVVFASSSSVYGNVEKIPITEDFEKKPKVENQVVYLGRDSYEKGIDVLKKAESKIKGKVVYCTDLPWSEAMSVLQSSSVLVLPSRLESLPATVKEAFFLKIPVVATNVGGVPELITNNENGILVQPNDPEKLSEAVNKILENEEQGASFANKGYEFVMKNMTWDVVFSQYLKLYENLVN